MTMEPKWIRTLLMILAFYQRAARGAEDQVVAEGADVDIVCRPADSYSMAIWFRVLDDGRMQYIASFARDGSKKETPTPLSPTFDLSKMSANTLKLRSFSREQDSGVYGCACINSNELRFGKVTRLVGEKRVEVKIQTPAAVTARPDPPAAAAAPTPTPKACACPSSPDRGEPFLDLYCSILILAPLASGCGLLLLLLIVTILYCNRIRTRRCPHHHNRKPRPMTPGKQMGNRHT